VAEAVTEIWLLAVKLRDADSADVALKDSVSLRANAVTVREQVTVAERKRESEYVLLLVGPTEDESLEETVADMVSVAVISSETVEVMSSVGVKVTLVVPDCASVALPVADVEQDKVRERDVVGSEGDKEGDGVVENSVVGDSVEDSLPDRDTVRDRSPD
jgi:hypothetical protein